MRRSLLFVLVPVIGLAVDAAIVHAQPGPSAPLELPEIRTFGARIHDAEATLASPTRDPERRIHAAHDCADALAHLSLRVGEGPAAGGPSSIASGAEAELRRLTGLTFAQVPPAVPRAWQRCVAEVRTLHALDADARDCIEQATRYGVAAAAHHGYALAAPPAFVAPVGATAATTQAIYRAAETRLAGHPDDVVTRRALAAMQLATADYSAVVATLRPLAGDYDADLTAALAVAANGDATADARFVALIAQAPSRPEAYYDRSLVARPLAYETEDLAARAALRRRQFDALRAFLCTRGAAVLPGPPDVFETAAREAETTQWQALGGSHWAYRSEAPRPPPFLPESVLPPDLQDGPLPGPTPSATCADALAAAAR